MSEEEKILKEIPYWPYCPMCEQPFDFGREEPFAQCNCGTREWGYPRPAPYVMNPILAANALRSAVSFVAKCGTGNAIWDERYIEEFLKPLQRREK